MIGSVAPPAATALPDASADAALRRACAQLEGVFMQELMKALRDTVPEGTTAGAGEDMFTGLLDQHLADSATARLERGLGAALYRQIRAAAGSAAPAAPPERGT